MTPCLMFRGGLYAPWGLSLPGSRCRKYTPASGRKKLILRPGWMPGWKTTPNPDCTKARASLAPVLDPTACRPGLCEPLSVQATDPLTRHLTACLQTVGQSGLVPSKHPGHDWKCMYTEPTQLGLGDRSPLFPTTLLQTCSQHPCPTSLSSECPVGCSVQGETLAGPREEVSPPSRHPPLLPWQLQFMTSDIQLAYLPAHSSEG
jgi:hypothetical protein